MSPEATPPARAKVVAGLVFKAICYLALAIVLSGIAAILIVEGFSLCRALDDPARQCSSAFGSALVTWGTGVLMLTVFTGLPALLALLGIVFLVRDLWRRFRR